MRQVEKSANGIQGRKEGANGGALCHDSSIRTSEFGLRVGLGPRSRATVSPPSVFARVYKASRASSSAVRFARERRASASCAKKKTPHEKKKH